LCLCFKRHYQAAGCRLALIGLFRYLPDMEIQCTFVCAYCFEENETMVDGSGAPSQHYVEDCQVCCRPNLLTIIIDPEGESAIVYADPE